MANWFEDITKTMADEKIGRRTALRRVGATVAGVALASVGGVALANGSKRCPGGGGVCGSYVVCTGNNSNCLCFKDPKGFSACGCDAFCSTLTACNTNHDCPKGSFCAVSTCCPGTPNVCLLKCQGVNKNCSLGAGHGATSAHR